LGLDLGVEFDRTIEAVLYWEVLQEVWGRGGKVVVVIPTRLGLDVVRDDSEKEVKCWIRGGDD